MEELKGLPLGNADAASRGMRAAHLLSAAQGYRGHAVETCCNRRVEDVSLLSLLLEREELLIESES